MCPKQLSFKNCENPGNSSPALPEAPPLRSRAWVSSHCLLGETEAGGQTKVIPSGTISKHNIWFPKTLEFSDDTQVRRDKPMNELN